jgi:hypothetical protein
MKLKKLITAIAVAAVGLGTATILTSRAEETTNEYVAPADAVPKGKAPKMQVQLLTPGEPTKQYAVIFYQGDEAFSGLLEFAQKYHVTSAHFTAIGAVNGATLGWFDPQRKMYKKIPINGQHEVIGMSGDIALYQGRNYARGPCPRCLCVPDAGSNGHSRFGNDAEAFRSGHGSDVDRSGCEVAASHRRRRLRRILQQTGSVSPR